MDTEMRKRLMNKNLRRTIIYLNSVMLTGMYGMNSEIKRCGIS